MSDLSSKAKKPFYITTTLPYVNAEPHIGHAVEFIRADIIARWKRLAGFDVFFNVGTDEHGMKIYKAAATHNITPQEYADKYADRFRELIKSLDLMTDVNFVRTTDEAHRIGAQKFWSVVDKNGFIYKKQYSIKYCVGCELEKTESELVNGRCPLHPLQEIEIIEEENYFFKFSAFREKLLDLYENKNFVIPEARLNEIKAFIERGPEDFSISRLASKMSWGIPVPGDSSQVMYVWFDALSNYVSVIGWPDRAEDFKRWWVDTGGAVQYCGKDNLRQQSAMWQAMLMAANLPPSKKIIVNGHITGDGGIKMSKSIGNVVNPFDVIKEYGHDAMRYYAARELAPFEDSPFTPDKFKEAYNANLANGIGNLVSRVLKLTSDYGITAPLLSKEDVYADETAQAFAVSLDELNIQRACDHIWARISDMDGEIQATQPFKLLKSADEAEVERGKAVMAKLYGELWFVAVLLEPVMPQTAATIQSLVKENKMPPMPLFARK